MQQQEFYFVRHGQTNGNLTKNKIDHGDIPLNEVGRAQAHSIRPLIASLPLKTICHSSLLRARETRDLACQDLLIDNVEIAELGECTSHIWEQMTNLGAKARDSQLEPLNSFMQKVIKGLNRALSHDGPVLIVAHGGVHWAICCLLCIEGHDWIIDNCVVTHFSSLQEGRWIAKILNEKTLNLTVPVQVHC